MLVTLRHWLVLRKSSWKGIFLHLWRAPLTIFMNLHVDTCWTVWVQVNVCVCVCVCVCVKMCGRHVCVSVIWELTAWVFVCVCVCVCKCSHTNGTQRFWFHPALVTAMSLFYPASSVPQRLHMSPSTSEGTPQRHLQAPPSICQSQRGRLASLHSCQEGEPWGWVYMAYDLLSTYYAPRTW